MLLGAAVMVIQVRRKRPSKAIVGGFITALALGPLGLDMVGWNVDVIPAAFTVLLGTYRLSRYADKIYTRSTTLLVPEAAVPEAQAADCDVYALRINNLADMPTAVTPGALGGLIDRVAETIRTTGDPSARYGRIGFEKDTLIWSAQRSARTEIEDHAAGLIAILSSASDVTLARRRLELSLGVDINHGEASADRIANACQAAEHAARRGERVEIADSEFLLEKTRRLAVLDAFDPALARGDLNVFYQPKQCLKTRRIAGVEALLRWTDKSLGEVNPEEVVAIAEEHGRMGS